MMTTFFATSGSGTSPSGWIVDGRSFHHTAARFWAGLLQDVQTDYPEANRITLGGLTAYPIDPDWLTPEKALARVFEEWFSGNVEATLQDTIDEIALLGPPAGVRVRIGQEEVELFEGALPLETVDEEVFLYLLTWLLEWAAIPHALWDQPQLNGSFLSITHDTRLHYQLDVHVETNPAQEGLMERHVTIQFRQIRHSPVRATDRLTSSQGEGDTPSSPK